MALCERAGVLAFLPQRIRHYNEQVENMPPIPASSSSTATATTRTAEAQAAFQERFYNVYHSLIASGMSHVDSAAKALLVAGGQATTEEFNNTSPSTNPHESCPATTGAAGAGVAGAAAPAAAAAAAAAGAAVGVSQAAGSSQAAADVVPQGAALPEGAALLGVGQACDAATEGANATASARSVVEYQSSTAHQSSALFQSVPPESSRQTAVPSADSDGDASLKDRGSNKSRGSSSAEMSQNEPQEQQQRQEKAERTGRNEPRATAAVAPPPAPPQELIRAGRLLELIEIERATGGGNFRELIRFLGRTMSNPACVGASFALPRPRDSVGENARAGNESSGGGNDSGGVSSPNNPEASRGQKSSVSDLSHDAEKASVAAEELESVLKSGSGRDGRCDGEGGGAERGSTSVSGERAGGAVHDDRERQFSSTEDIAIATRPLPLGRADHASAGVSAGAEEKFVAEVTSTVTTRNDRKAVDRTEGEEKTSPEREKWVDRSAVAMDVQAATDVWRVLRELDVEGVTGAVLNALESLTQTLLMDKILDGGRGEAHGWIDHGAVSSAGDEEGNRGYGDRAGLRSVVLVLEHPEIQDPDFESVLNSLFKLSMRLSESSREELCNFFAGLEVDRFSRYVMRLAEGRKCGV